LQYGGPHAEIISQSKLKQIADQSLIEQAKVLVTLEPCAHHGKTPPCVESLVKLPIGEVSYLVEDPNPLVKGKGREFLEQRGIKINLLNGFSDLGEEIARIFLFNQRQNNVYVGLKAATNNDGVYALKDSSKYWITSSRSREHGHFLRLEYDAILVGANTVKLDNPLLNIRSNFVTGRTPVRIILDPKGELDQTQTIFNSNEKATILLFRSSSSSTSKKTNFEIISLPLNQKGHFNWEDILGALWNQGVRSVLIEGGGKVWKSALDSKVVNRIHWYFGHRDIIDEANTLKINPPNLGAKFKHKFEEDRYFEKDL
jgi:diaminohydroxyphosphoribosylaminopyrimidine deaminase / 5-amino-6-(5-phosphoribosylamino)uracil reductase